MFDEDELPTNLIERANMLEGILISFATGRDADDSLYQHLRSEFIQNAETRDKLPTFVRTYRNLGSFWPYIKKEASSYAERKQLIGAAFTPLIDWLELGKNTPGDDLTSDVLRSFNPEGVHVVWRKALERRASDPEGAITIARTLLETVCKHILDESNIPFKDNADLPKLYALTAQRLNLAPDQHSEVPIKNILGGAMNLVNGIGTLRNRLSDSHGRGSAKPVKPSERHAKLAVNMAGTMATFLVETYLQKAKS